MKNLFCLTLIASAIVLSACGLDAEKKEPALSPKSPETLLLKVGRDLRGTDGDNRILFETLFANQPQTKYLIFKSSEKVVLYIAKNTYAIGWSCEDNGNENDFEMRLHYQVKKPGDESYSARPPAPGTISDSLDKIFLNPDDELQIAVEITPLVACSRAEVLLQVAY